MNGNRAGTLGLVADIGGTNARFALVDLQQPFPQLIEPVGYLCRDFRSIEEIARTYLEEHGAGRISFAALAVAGAVTQGTISFTNLNWSVSEDEFSRALGLRSTRFVNDYTALALASPLLSESDIVSVGPPRSATRDGTIAVLGAGTGFGVSALAREGSREAVLSTEGGHMAFAPADELEVEIWRWLLARFQRVSIERVLSGPGLANLYQAMCEIEGHAAPFVTPSEISEAAERGERMAGAVVERFCAILGSVAGDVALLYGARGGVFIAGGVSNRFSEAMSNGQFRARFEAKGRFADYVSAITTELILQPHQFALLGAAKALGRHVRRELTQPAAAL